MSILLPFQEYRRIQRLVKLGIDKIWVVQYERARNRGYEITNLMRKGQILGVPKGAIKERLVFIHQIFRLVA